MQDQKLFMFILGEALADLTQGLKGLDTQLNQAKQTNVVLIGHSTESLSSVYQAETMRIKQFNQVKTQISKTKQN